MIVWTEFRSCALRHSYFYVEEDEDDFWYSIGRKLEELTCFHLMKLKDRPQFVYSAKMGRLYLYADEIHENTPEGWTYYDDEIPKVSTTELGNAQPRLLICRSIHRFFNSIVAMLLFCFDFGHIPDHFESLLTF